MEIHINSGEIKSGLFLAWTYEEHTPGRKNTVRAGSDAPIHEDLANAFQNLLPHMLLVSEFKGKADFVKHFDLGNELPEEITSKFKVTSFTTKEVNGETHVTIRGHKNLACGKKFKIESPAIKPEMGDDDYEFYNHLIDAVDEVKNEIHEFMDGKLGTRAQMDMDFGEEDDFVPEEIVDEHAA